MSTESWCLLAAVILGVTMSAIVISHDGKTPCHVVDIPSGGNVLYRAQRSVQHYLTERYFETREEAESYCMELNREYGLN